MDVQSSDMLDWKSFGHSTHRTVPFFYLSKAWPEQACTSRDAAVTAVVLPIPSECLPQKVKCLAVGESVLPDMTRLEEQSSPKTLEGQVSSAIGAHGTLRSAPFILN